MNKGIIIKLKGIDIDSIHTKYNIDVRKNVTKINDLDNTRHQQQTFSFLDESRHNRLFNVSYIKTNECKYHCFWDRHPIPSNTYPIYCPIRYEPDRIKKTYISHITKNIYEIREDTDLKTVSALIDSSTKTNKFSMIQNGNYVTDGIFCSFNCCQAYINDNKTNPEFMFSTMLLMKIYNQLYPSKEITSIIPAPHWRVLNEYGGNKTIDEFRSTFNCIEYVYNGTITFTQIGHLYEEKLRLN